MTQSTLSMEGLEIFICVVVCWRLEFNPYVRCNFAETKNLRLFVACRNAFGWRLFPSSTCGRLEERSTLLKGFLHKWDKHTAQGTHTHITHGATQRTNTHRGGSRQDGGWRFFTGELQMKVLILTSGCRRLWDACGVWGHHFDTSFVFSSTAAGLSPCAVFLSIVQYSNQSVYWTTRHFILFWSNNNLSQLLPPNDLSNWKESVFPTIIQLRLYVFAGELFSAHIGENCHFFLTRYLLNLSAWLEH